MQTAVRRFFIFTFIFWEAGRSFFRRDRSREMWRIISLSAVLICAFSIACWRSNTENQSNTEANSTDAFAEINDADQAVAIGDQALDNNETEKAIDAYLRATEINPDLADAWFKLGIAYGLIEKEQAL